MMKGLPMTLIYAQGALQRFLTARTKGFSRDEMLAFKAAAEAERRPMTARVRSAAPVSRGAVVDLDRARLEREWSRATTYD